jgi:hypothetical protein
MLCPLGSPPPRDSGANPNPSHPHPTLLLDVLDAATDEALWLPMKGTARFSLIVVPMLRFGGSRACGRMVASLGGMMLTMAV